MSIHYQARWATPDRVRAMRRTGQLRNRVVLDSLRGFIVVEPAEMPLGDGKTLSRDEANYELDSAWCRDPHSTVEEARKRLGLGG